MELVPTMSLVNQSPCQAMGLFWQSGLTTATTVLFIGLMERIGPRSANPFVAWLTVTFLGFLCRCLLLVTQL